MEKSLWKGYAAGALAAACYGLNPGFALPLYQAGLTPDSVLFLRYFFALIFVGILMKVRHQSFALERKQILPLAAMGLLFSLSSLTLFLSYNYMDAGIASTILFMYPVLTAILMIVFFHEKVNWITLLSIALAFIGISLLTETGDGGTISWIGFILVFLSSLSYALYIIGVNRSFLKSFPTVKLSFYALLFGSLIYVIRLNGCTLLQWPQSWLQWGCALGLAFFPTVCSLVLMAISIHHVGSTHASILGALEPVTALCISVFLFDGDFTFRILIGVILILTAVTLIVVRKKK